MTAPVPTFAKNKRCPRDGNRCPKSIASLAIAVLMLVPAPPTKARVVEWSPPTRVSLTSAEASTGMHPDDVRASNRRWHGHQVASRGVKTAVVFTVQGQAGAVPESLMCAVQPAAGGPWNSPELVMVAGIRIENPTIAIAPSGQIHILVEDRKPSGPDRGGEIDHYYSTDSGHLGLSWAGPAAVSDPADSEPTVEMPDGIAVPGCPVIDIVCRNPELVIDDVGNLYATWWQQRNAQDVTNLVDPCDVRPINGILMGARLGAADVGLPWTDRTAVSSGTWDIWGETDEVACDPKALYRPSYRTGPRPHTMTIGPGGSGDVFFVFKDDPYPLRADGSPPDGAELDSSGDVIPGTFVGPGDPSWCNFGVNADSDHYYFKRGAWSSGQFAWWGLAPSIQLGTDVRVTPRGADKEVTVVNPNHPADPLGQQMPPSYSHTTQDFWMGAQPSGAIAVSNEPSTGPTAHLFFKIATPYGHPTTPSKDNDVLVRRFQLNGTSKDAAFYIASKTPTEVEYDSNVDPSAAADSDHWVHLIYGRLGNVVTGSENDSYDVWDDEVPGLPRAQMDAFWQNSDRQVYYSTNDATGMADEWGYEMPISAADLSVERAAAYASLAIGGNDILHAVWTEYMADPGGAKTSVMVSEGRVIDPNIVANESWSGNVLVNSDVTVAAGAQLTIAAGTTVFFQAPYGIGPDNEVPMTGTVGLNVAGSIIVGDVAGEPVTFTSTRKTTGGEWNGIRFVGDATSSMSTIDNVVIDRAIDGITFEGQEQRVSMSSVSFQNLSGREVFLRNDTVIPPGEAWTFSQPMTIGVDGAGTPSTGGVDEARIELIVEGSLQLTGAPASIAIEDVTGTASPGEWYGIRLTDTATTLDISGAVIRHARTAVSLDGFSLIPSPAAVLASAPAVDNYVSLGFARDYELTAALTVPANMKVGFAPGPSPGMAEELDPARVELRVAAGNTLSLGDGAVLLSDDPAVIGASTWYGVVLEDPNDIAAGSGVVIRDARAAVVLDGAVAPTTAHLNAIDAVTTALENTVDVSLARDYAVTDFDVPAGMVVGFRSEGSSADPDGVDDGRVELELSGPDALSLGDDARLCSDAPSGGTQADWYGVRVADFSTQIGTIGVGAQIADARSGIALESSTMPDLNAVQSLTGGNGNWVDLSLDRDHVLATSLTLPMNFRMGFTAKKEAAGPGQVLNRVELVVPSSLTLTLGAGSSLRSDVPGGSDVDDWFGVRVSSAGQVTATGAAEIANARAGLAVEGPLPTDLQAAVTNVTFTSCHNWVSTNRDQELTGNLVVPAEFRLGFAPQDESPSGPPGIDDDLVELILTGTATIALLQGSSLRSTDPTGASRWFGVRTPAIGKVFPLGSEIRDARVGVALEKATLAGSDLATLDSQVAFANNWTDVGVNQDQVLASSLTVPAGLQLGFAAADSGHASVEGVDTKRVELIVPNGVQLTLNGTLKSDDPGAGPGAWYGVWLLSKDGLATSTGTISHAVAGLSLPDPNVTDWHQNTGITFPLDANSEKVVYVAPKGGTTTWDNAFWTGRILPVDFFVAPSGTLRIAAATTVNIEEGQGIEIRADGPILAEGDSGSRILVTGAGGNDLSWDGVRFLDGEDGDAVSSFKYVDFDGPVHAVTVDSLSGDIFHCGFDASSAADIYVPQDTRLKEGFEWNLDGPTRVKALAGADLRNAQWGEVSDRVEILVQGRLNTDFGGPSEDERVVFTSTAENPGIGDDWYGTTVWGGQARASISGADFGYATFPLAFIYADQASVGRSHFHHYQDTAITDIGSDSVIWKNTVWRGGLVATSGLTGIRVSGSFATVEQDTVFAQVDSGILLDGNQGYCEGPPKFPWNPGYIYVNDVTVVGTGDPGVLSNGRGIRIKWMCHEIKTIVENSNIQNWVGTSGFGVSVVNSSDVTVRCNCVRSNRIGLFHKRKLLPLDNENGISKIRQNNFDKNTVYNVESGSGPANGVAGMHFGVDGNPSSGENRLEVAAANTINYRLFPNGFGQVDSAHVNTWINENGAVMSLANIPSLNEVRMMNTLQLDSPGTSDPALTCGVCAAVPTPPASGGNAYSGGGEQASRSAGYGGTAQEPPSTATLDLPDQFLLYPPVPSPTRESVRIRFDIPASASESVDLAIFDVAGRRVRQVNDGPRSGGRHTFSWDLKDGRGAAVSPGVYFVRVDTRSYRRVRKLVVLR